MAEVVGLNAKRLREPHTADQMSRHARWAGLRWNSGRVADLEKGRIAPTVSNLVAVAAALRSLTGQDVTLADLVTHDGPVELNEAMTIPGARLAGYLSGDPVQRFASEEPSLTTEANESARVMREYFMGESFPDPNFGLWQNALRRTTDADERAAADLGVSVAEMLAVAVQRWGRGFSAERDYQAGEGANNQKRGRIARQLKDELREALSDGNH
ncbi:hypothetical protein AB0H58_16715 [Nocardia neocaledoniensis]|uniref:hypothetical protein n=1 Tax=Nocardia neocaledoniensis TaxID=236511 RepID=UPI0033DAA100